MRDFNFQEGASTSAANTDANMAGVSPRLDEQPPQILGDEEPSRFEREEAREDALNTFHRSSEDEDDRTGNTAKIAGAVLVGLLLVGGGIYAYQSSSATRTPQKVAMIPPAPKPMPTDEAAAQPPVQSAPEASPANSDNNAAAAPAPSTPKPIHRSGLASVRPSSSSSQQDAAVSQPMTLTPQTAPAPEQAAANNNQPAPAPQTAMQQPITAPTVVAPTVQPAPELANNAPGGVTATETTPSPAAAQPAPAPSPAQGSAQADTTPAPAPAQ